MLLHSRLHKCKFYMFDALKFILTFSMFTLDNLLIVEIANAAVTE